MKLMKGFSEDYMQINTFFSEFCMILNPNIQLQLFQGTTQFKLYESEQTGNKRLSPHKTIFFKDTQKVQEVLHWNTQLV